MGKEFGKTLKQNILMNIMICILKVSHYFSLMFFENFRKMCLKFYQLDFAKFLSALQLA